MYYIIKRIFVILLMPKTSSSKRNFKVVIVNKEHGLYCSSSPSSAARKAVSKLCATDKKKKVEFSLREITRGSDGKTYGPYLGYIEKLKVPIQLKGRLIEYKPNAKLIKKTGVKKGGWKKPNHLTTKEWNKTNGLKYTHPERLVFNMFEWFNERQIPENFTDEQEKYMHDYAISIPEKYNYIDQWNYFRKKFEKETNPDLLKLQKKVRECEYFPFRLYIKTPTKCDDYLYLVGNYNSKDREYMREYCHYMSSLSNKNINSINSTTEQEIYELKLGCGLKDNEDVRKLQKIVDEHMGHDSNKVNKISKFREKSIREFKKKMNDIYKSDLTQEEREYMSEYYAYYTSNINNTNNENKSKLNEINDKYKSLGDKRNLKDKVQHIIYNNK